jgi:hypothetical protein
MSAQEKQRIKLLDNEMADLDTLLSYASIRKEVLWVESNYNGGGALHIVIEDGNIEDVNIQWCIDQMEANVWEGYAADVDDNEKPRFLKLAKDLLELKHPYRELIINGGYITERLFNHLYNDEDL